ncbi:thioredoxin domain-containing protein [cyanobacterium endosymbiont of Epithemia turgida]|uniref:thioredoxin domain-containing protein n=1 Tax=cyanobacterium endosymbiont of Epithemia turgida TaxID=718217 RepID=UPI0004D1A64A|nr:thioredoxin domain-containing protein [cyanobacterium endosymbiont of Epithemia turgida]BAP17073.1 putative six-hairpin glycosidase familly protein [cyanobacterium endosymbiont of Epithemia turgida isolate EtSB Lake Yunoko]
MSNRLAMAQSLYLRKHADNPIDWWYWCEEALSRAHKQNKPIFLSIGYSSCHWCTVMEREAFCDKVIADYLNINFLPIKVDREERPDLDRIYIKAVQMMGLQGGWPLNIFLTPGDMVPFYGGTYFPVEPRYGRPGFLRILQLICRFYETETKKLNNFKQEFLTTLRRSALFPSTETELLNNELFYQGITINTEIIKVSSQNVDYPCFPMIPYVNLVLQGSRFAWNSQEESKAIANQRGEDLALGGIYDHVGGGFHRYTIDPTWTVPHFEKMLYDNGQIIEYLANLWSQGQTEPAFKRAITLTVEWLQREMTAPQGYFYASQDADNFTTTQSENPEEGAFYVWSYKQLQDSLTLNELKVLAKVFFITPQGNFEGKNVLQLRQKGVFSEDIEKILDKLFILRYGNSREDLITFPPVKNKEEVQKKSWTGRISPVTDTKMIVAWNSLMISGLARTYGVFREPLYWKLAIKATEFILNKQWKEKRLHRLNYSGNPSVLAQSEDYALFIKALLDLQTANPSQTQWLEKAINIQQEFDEFFWSMEKGGYFDNASDNSEDLLVRERNYIDNATPSANGIAISNLVRLARLTDNLKYLNRAEQGLQAFSSVLSQSPKACPSLFLALDWYRFGNLVRSNPEVLKQLSSQYFPTTVYRVDNNLPNNSVGLLCQGLICLEPAKTMEELLKQIQESNSLNLQ